MGGRELKGKWLIHDGARLYSYGSHYVAACIAQLGGRAVAFVNNEDYEITDCRGRPRPSPSTKRHVSAAMSAARKAGLTVIKSCDPSRASPQDDCADFAELALAAIAGKASAVRLWRAKRYWNLAKDSLAHCGKADRAKLRKRLADAACAIIRAGRVTRSRRIKAALRAGAAAYAWGLLDSPVISASVPRELWGAVVFRLANGGRMRADRSGHAWDFSEASP
jgi:hypothetical protein